MDRTLVIDENLDKRIATDLRSRGRRAVAHSEISTTGLLDEAVLELLAALAYPWVLVTADDKLPFEHAEAVVRLGATIATIDGEWEAHCSRHELDLNQDQFQKDSIHRWAHSMASQEQGTVRRLTPATNILWKPRKKYAM